MERTFAVRTGRDLSRAVREARITRGLTQEQFADKAGLDRSYLAKMESGLTVVLLDRVVRALRQLGAEVTVTIPDRSDGA